VQVYEQAASSEERGASSEEQAAGSKEQAARSKFSVKLTVQKQQGARSKMSRTATATPGFGWWRLSACGVRCSVSARLAKEQWEIEQQTAENSGELRLKTAETRG
jgi:hypothetical protein